MGVRDKKKIQGTLSPNELGEEQLWLKHTTEVNHEIERNSQPDR